jgi:hypothetical protein
MTIESAAHAAAASVARPAPAWQGPAAQQPPVQAHRHQERGAATPSPAPGELPRAPAQANAAEIPPPNEEGLSPAVTL